ncbi:Beta-adaptin-like protein A [Linum perenne]
MAPPAQSSRYPSPSQPSGKGEVSDLRLQLRQLAGSRAPGVDDSKRELFKKVISYMTIGIDVSSLFGEMVMCSVTPDIVLKKMCYLYVGNYAKVNPDLALLTINFLQRDCKDQDPMIRGLALRSLSSLRVANLVEYLVGPLGSGLKDSNAYVRTVAVMGVVKLYHISASTCVDSDFPATLKHLMLNDPEAQVVANCISALEEIWNSESSTSEEAAREKEGLISKPFVYYLLNRLRQFNEWGQCLVLELVSKYVPSESNETFDIMNLLEDRLQHANGAVVLSTIKVFLQLTLSMADVHQEVYERIKAPLLTLVSSGSPEQSYAVLSHLHLLVMRAPYIFASDYKHFYCQYNEPSYVKKLKLEMLTAVANESNTYEIVTELCEYAANVDVAIARESIRAVGKIALQQYDVNAIVDRLLQFLEMEKDYVTAEALVLVKDLVRKYPQWSHDCIAVVGNISSKNVQEPKAKAALIWMLGEYAQDMDDAPYVLESLAENWEEDSPEVRLHLLTAVMKCFFRRPPETQKALGIALAAGLADFHQDVHDRALFYYRLLQYDVSSAERVVNPPKQAVSVFADTQSNEVKDRIFDEFNSLSVVYQKPSYMFTDKEHRGPFEFSDDVANITAGTEPEHDVPASSVEANETSDLLLSISEKDETKALVTNGSDYTAPLYDTSITVQASHGQSALALSSLLGTDPAPQSSLALDDLLLGLDLTAPSAPASLPPTLKLNARAVLDAGNFQRKWRELPVAVSQECELSSRGAAALTTAQALLQHMQGNSIQCIASGGQSPNFKFFFFAQKAEEASMFLVECKINTSTAKAQVSIKAEDQSTSQEFWTLFQTALSKFADSEMALAAASRRFFTPATRRSTLSLPSCFQSRLRNFSSSISASDDTLLHKLLRLSTSQIKPALDSEFAAVEASSDLASLVARLASSSPQKAKLALEWRLERMLKDNEKDHSRYSSLISLCATIRNVPLAMSVFTSMEACGINPTASVFNSLIHTCLSSSDVMTSLSLFEVMESSERFRPDSQTFDTFISGFSNLRDTDKMRAWYQAKRDAGFSANLLNFESLVFCFVKVKDFNSADFFYQEMMALGIVPSLKVLDCVLDGLCKRKNCDRVMEFVKFMLECRFEISGTSVDKVVKLYSELEKADKMEELLDTLMEFNQVGEALLQVHCGIIRLYATLDRLDEVEYSVGKMMSQGMSFSSPGDVEKVISAYFRQEAYDRLELFLEHVKRYYKLSRSTHDLLVAGYRRAGLTEKLESVVKDMELS